MDARAEERLWRARELLGSVGLAVWAGFHLWEQWSGFGGRESFVARMLGTSQQTHHLIIEFVLGVLPAVLWVLIEARIRLGIPEPRGLAMAMAEDEETARRLGYIVRVSSWLFYGWLLYHVAWLWLPKLTDGADPLWTWIQLRGQLGGWARAGFLAVGLSAFLFHAWGALPRLMASLDLMATPETRRAARLSGLIVALGVLVLYAQLAGWHAAGAGAIWPL